MDRSVTAVGPLTEKVVASVALFIGLLLLEPSKPAPEVAIPIGAAWSHPSPPPSLPIPPERAPVLSLAQGVGPRSAASSHVKKVALTFDDGPDPVYTPLLLDVLQKERAPATFFLIGRSVKQHPQVAQRIAAEGHALGNHTYSHRRLTSLSSKGVEEEISKTHRIIEYYTGVTPLFFRPPYGAYDRRVKARVSEMGYVMVLWDATAADYRGLSSDAIYHQVLSTLKPVSVILLHDGGGNRHASVEATKKLIPKLRDQGYQIVPIWDLADRADTHTILY